MIAEARQFSQKLTDEVVSSYLVESEKNRFGVINAFTHAAQRMAPHLGRMPVNTFPFFNDDGLRCGILRFS